MVTTLEVGGIKIEFEAYRIESCILKGVQVARRYKCHTGSSGGHIPYHTHKQFENGSSTNLRSPVNLSSGHRQ